MIFAIDVDNVLNNLQEAVITLFNERYNTHYTMEGFKDYNVENVLPMHEAIIMKKMYAEEGLYNLVKPIAGSQEALEKLINMGHQVYLVSDVIPKTYSEKTEWIRHFFPFIDEGHIVAMKHKHLLRCDVMIEDNLHNLLSGVHYNRICFDYPWNRSIRDYAYNIHRCNNWKQIMDAINKINEEE